MRIELSYGNVAKLSCLKMESTVEDDKLFGLAVETVLEGWTALQLAVKHGFGGQDGEAKAAWMVSAIDQWFSENSGIEAWEVEGFLADILSAEFDTVADDGSLSQVSKQICEYYKQWKECKYDDVRNQISMLPKAALSQCVSHICTEDEDDDMEYDDNHEEAVTEQLGDMNLTEEPLRGACALPTESNMAENNNENTSEENTNNSTEKESEDTEWTVVHRPKSKKKPR